ncbi:hypothetical protein LSCM1_05411 [Leishmania martiniquensis]|uniref:Kinesin motor domain-containing protein n=1 Tax=Leishmania martiniquensis TaxID=1580590 RepID=A0A836HFW1_9TRYP|nr:hypothetical protein LSCM1_05411 [Leishmania martiniquensis]
MSASSIKVAVRCRPLFGQERPAGGLDIQGRRILLDSKTYDPDFTFPPTSTQEDIFQACRPILQCVKEGMNGTIMVYGQTGTGKTYTMLGGEGGGEGHGLVHKVVANMLEHVQHKTSDGAQCALTLSMIEIYNERLTDMLSPNGEEEVTLISGFPRFTHKVTLCRVNDAIETIQRGLAWRHTAATLMNERSSRSHVVFIFDMEEYNSFTEQTEVAHLFMIDLAGSESLKKSQASGVAAGEAGKINKSLLALKSVFLALSNTNEATRPSHVPYRDSKLTELLQDSIGGTARTLMIACISSVGRDIEETKSTLLYAVKARSIRNAANTEREKLLVRLRSIEVENQKLRNRLQERVAERGGYYITKEEHEQTQEMAESYGHLKETVEQLMQDRQSSDARQHIWESQVKVLRALLTDKEAELQNFKEVYHEALKRFEYQATALQRMVRGGVADAKDAVKRSFSDNYARLHAWRTELLNALEDPVPTALPSPLPLSPAGCPSSDAAAAALTESEAEVHPQKSGISASRCAQDAFAATTPERRSFTPPPSQSTGSRGIAGAVPNGSPSRTAVAAAALSHPGRPMTAAAPFSARGSTASSLQRGSVTSGGPSASVSPTRRPARPRHGGGGATASSGPRRCLTGNSSTIGTLRGSGAPPLSSPPIGACPPPPLAPPPSSGVTDAPAQDGSEDCCGSTTAMNVSDVPAPLLMIRATSTSMAPPAWSAVMEQYDAQCLHTVHRLNEAVAAMLNECLQSFAEYKEHVERAELSRRRGIEEVCRRLRSELNTNLNQLQRLEAVGERDVREARESFSDQLRLRAKMPSLADAAPFQLAVRDACADVVRHAAHVFPHPGTPAEAEAALDVMVRKMQRCSAAFALRALDPLSSSAVGVHAPSVAACRTTTSSSSAASSPILGTAMSVWGCAGGSSSPQVAGPVPIPPLEAPLPCESPAAAAPLCSQAGSPSEEELECGSLGGHFLQGGRGTMPVSSPSQQQQQSTRASSLHGSPALAAIPLNGNRGGDTRRGGGASNRSGPSKRSRSAAASSTSSGGGLPPSSRRAMAARRSGR